jgi:hypothetical protein
MLESLTASKNEDFRDEESPWRLVNLSVELYALESLNLFNCESSFASDESDECNPLSQISFYYSFAKVHQQLPGNNWIQRVIQGYSVGFIDLMCAITFILVRIAMS